MSAFKETFSFKPLSDITTPKPGLRCTGPSWWAVNDRDEVIFYGKNRSPQCNVDKTIVEHIMRHKGHPGVRVVFVEMAFLPER